MEVVRYLVRLSWGNVEPAPGPPELAFSAFDRIVDEP